MNRAFLLFLWMRFRWLTIIVILANIFAAVAIASDWSNWLLVLGCMMIPMITIGLGAGATKSMWKLRYDLLSRLSTYVAHEVQQNGAPRDGDMTAAQVFIRRYPWIYDQATFQLQGTIDMSSRGRIADLLIHIGKGNKQTSLNARYALDIDRSTVKRLMKICR